MVTRAQIDRLRQRVEALVPPPKPDCSGALDKFRQRINGIAVRLGHELPQTQWADATRRLHAYFAAARSAADYKPNRAPRPQN
jgi:hypothetical protein